MQSSAMLPLLNGFEAISMQNRSEAPSPRKQREKQRIQHLPVISSRARRSPVLHRSPTAADPSVLSLNLARGCYHRCAFCSLRGHAAYEGDREVYLYRNTAEQLERELSLSRFKPRAVILSPSCDPFAPDSRIQRETLAVVRVLARRGIDSWIMTRGFIRPEILHELVSLRTHLRMRLAMTTLDRALQRRLEPLAAPPTLRLRQLRALLRAGVAIEVAIEPLLPAITDTSENLRPLLSALGQCGIRQVSAGYAFLRTGIRQNLRRAFSGAEVSFKKAESAYMGGPILSCGRVAPGRYLSRKRRERGYARLSALAAEVNIRVTLSTTTNPDYQVQASALETNGLRTLRSLLGAAGAASSCVGAQSP